MLPRLRPFAQSHRTRYHIAMDSTGTSPSAAQLETEQALPVLPEPSRRNSTLVGFFALIVLAFLLGLFACAMNRAFYVRHAPFFDSCAYDNLMANVISATRQHGLVKAIPVSMSTNYLPWLQTAVLTKWFPKMMLIERTTAVWLQMSWTVPLLLSLFVYFHIIRRLDGLTAFACTIPFVSFPVLFGANGGFSDFRMDLGLYLFFSLTAVWFLATYETDRWYPWIFLGLAAGLTGLERATSPVYLVASMGVPLVIRIIVSPKRLSILLKAAAAAVIAGLVCGWFFIANLTYLKYYYLDWNVDSKTNMSLWDASQHFFFVRDMHLGWPIMKMCLAVGVVIFLAAGPRAIGARLREPLKFLMSFNWVPLYIGLAPAAMLTVQRAGLNPFVSMPACFGILMFLLTLDANPIKRPRPAIIGVLLAATTMIFLVYTAIGGIAIHAADPGGMLEPTMASHHKVVDTILSEADARGQSNIVVAGTHLLGLHSIGLGNVFTFDYGFRPLDNQLIRKKTSVQLSSLYQPAAAVELRGLGPAPLEAKDLAKTITPDETLALEDARINELVLRANHSVDYLMVPDEETVKFAEGSDLRRNYANVICRRVRDRVLAGGTWEQVGQPILVSPKETVLIYANRHGTPTTMPSTLPTTQPER